MDDWIELENRYIAQHYAPLPVVLSRGDGVYVWDVNGKQYLDMMSAYSAVSHGHCHPELIQALEKQAKTLTITSRAYYHDKLAPFLKRLCELSGLERALPMNTGAEAVETAIKAARKWAYTIKGVKKDQAEILACQGNFHGRTTTIVGLSDIPQYRAHFGPFPTGLRTVPFGDPAALEKAITPNTAAFLVEPIQGEGGIQMPPSGYLATCAEICKKHNVLFILDEIQTGLGRTGKWFAYQHDDIQPDGLLLGKALGGGFYPVSVFLSRQSVMDVFTPGDHGSTFGGNPLAASIGLKALEILERDRLIENSATLGKYFIEKLKHIRSELITDIRGKGLFIGIEIDPEKTNARALCLQLLEAGILSKETHDTVIRLAPPLTITREQIDKACDIIQQVLTRAL